MISSPSARRAGSAQSGQRSAAPRAIDEPVGLMDLAPTILSWAGAPAPAYLEGQALQPCLTLDRTDALPEYVFCEDNYLVMIRPQNRKLVYYIDQPYGELYDLEADPAETTNVGDLNPDVVAHISTIMQEARTESELFPLLRG